MHAELKEVTLYACLYTHIHCRDAFAATANLHAVLHLPAANLLTCRMNPCLAAFEGILHVVQTRLPW